MFLWNGTPAPAPNVDPTAVATGDCPTQSLTCTFDSALEHGRAPTAPSSAGPGPSRVEAPARRSRPSHTFPGGGDFDATLTVTDDRGGTDS